MAKRRMRIEFDDGKGGNYTLTLDGILSREKALKLIDIVELLGATDQNNNKSFTEGTVLDRIYQLIEQQFTIGSFTSSELLEAYEDKYSEPIKTSTLSTYLSRLSEKGLLRRQRALSGWTYRRARIPVV